MQTVESSPFHRGEQKIQSMLGVRDKMERFGRQVIRDHLPEQHQQFYAQLPFVFVGHADQQGWPWASILFNPPGFISSPNPEHLLINARPVPGDPLINNLQAGVRLGLLGIELQSRRRNRLAGRISNVGQHLEIKVEQTFGNCPQYIQTRSLEFIPPSASATAEIEEITSFNTQQQKLISQSDTFFVASYVNTNNNSVSEGVDVSHRGGKPGFIRIDNDQQLTIPDYLGNFHFNTLGNFLENPKAGLLFIDFEHGHILTLTGTVEILWDATDSEFFKGAERLWRFKLDHGRFIKNALPLRWTLNEYSPNTQLTGSWAEAAALQQAQADRERWMPYRVEKIVPESSVIKSFYLSPINKQRPNFTAGQFLTLKASINGEQKIRTYTVSSAPGDEFFRISVKHETATQLDTPDGLFSSYLHEQISVGDSIEIKAPTGTFTFDTQTDRPAVLISAGIGITPMVSMLRHAMQEAIRTRSMRPITCINAAQDFQQRAFFEEINTLAQNSNGYINSYWILSQINQALKAGVDYHHQGRINKAFLQAILALDNYDFYLCGPPGFMQACYDILRELGVNNSHIYSEEFGPASLKRDQDAAFQSFTQEASAEHAIVEFSDSQVEQAWSKADGNLLEFAEAHGLNPAYGCRSGQCGSCKVKLLAGKVAYQQAYSAEVEKDQVLLCCAMPAKSATQEITRLKIAL